MTVAPSSPVMPRAPTSAAKRGLLVLAVALAPSMAAVWAVPWFVPQDAPAHVYNAEILSRSFDPSSPLTGIFAIRWQPIPNWAAHVLLAGLVRIVPAWAADRILTGLTLASFAASVFWLRLRVAGSRADRESTTGADHVPAAILSALLAMNLTWLLGFTSFGLGACLFPITMAVWWPRRDRLGASGAAGLASLLVLGYFCHLVSLGLTLMSIGVLAIATPMPPGPRGRAIRARFVPLILATLPMVPLGLLYLGMVHRGGPIRPLWDNLADPFSLSGWKSQLSWVDPITLMRKDALPFTDRVGPAFLILAPVLWLAGAMLVWGTTRVLDRIRSVATARRDDRRGWWVLAMTLIFLGAVGPDTMGAEHGNYLPQRVVLFGLVVLAVALEIDTNRRPGRVAVAGLAMALALQSAIVWDYALDSDRTAGAIVRARDDVGRGRRVAFLPARVRGRFRANPLLHVDNWLGVGTDNIIWGNYETRHYYFPVQFRTGIDRPRPEELEEILLSDAPVDAERRARRWEQLLARTADTIDVLVTYRDDPRLDAVSSRYFREVRRRGEVRILVRDPAPRADAPLAADVGLAAARR